VTSGSLEDVAALNRRFSGADPAEVLGYAAAHWNERLAVACSLGVEDVVILQLLSGLPPAADAVRVFTLDTGRLHEETYDLLDRLRTRYARPIALYFPEATLVERLVRDGGPRSFLTSVDERKKCCAVRKLGPLARALDGADAWVTGLRRGQSSARAETDLFELDAANGGRVKVSPLAGWSEEQVWSYVREHDVPYNALHDAGYPSIGCAPCTRAVAPGEDPRGGRWWWETMEEGRECGLHSPRRPKQPHASG